MNREDVVQAALTVERWCRENYNNDVCDCPFADNKMCFFFNPDMPDFPVRWNLEAFLRTRGIKHET